MSRSFLLALAVLLLAAVPAFADDPTTSCPGITVAADDLAQRGCCSWHGGVCGCSWGRVVCCDGGYSPSCSCDKPAPDGVLLAKNKGGRPKGVPVDVDGYIRKDRAYVGPHQRSGPDGDPSNNFNTPGNFNPNTPGITPGSPSRFFDRYDRERGR